MTLLSNHAVIVVISHILVQPVFLYNTCILCFLDCRLTIVVDIIRGTSSSNADGQFSRKLYDSWAKDCTVL